MASERDQQFPTYTPEQIRQYYDRITLPQSYRNSLSKRDVAQSSEALELLTALIRHQLAAIPFENLEISYSTHHSTSVKADHLFEKIVAKDAGRGGWCLELNCLFSTVLRSIGYDVFCTGARVSSAVQPVAGTKSFKGPQYDPWNHMISIVTISKQRYLVDVGFGASGGPNLPIPLIPSHEALNTASQYIQLSRGPITQNADPSQLLWLYAHRNGTTGPWTPTYAFTDTEFLPADFEMMNSYLSMSRMMWMTHVVLVAKKIVEGDEVVGEVSLFGKEVKRRIKGVSEVLAVVESEAERIEALKKYLGIRLTGAEQAGIQGLPAELL